MSLRPGLILKQPLRGLSPLSMLNARCNGPRSLDQWLMGLEAIYPKPRLSLAGPGHRIYPYLLRGVTIERSDQV